ncbi:hypothetical protein HY933_00755 [Candidatus Falkowbacteria bacterium]|nr:hypothetical protein [Candidatus Falkowbacteria bacterium]
MGNWPGNGGHGCSKAYGSNGCRKLQNGRKCPPSATCPHKRLPGGDRDKISRGKKKRHHN